MWLEIHFTTKKNDKQVSPTDRNSVSWFLFVVRVFCKILIHYVLLNTEIFMLRWLCSFSVSFRALLYCMYAQNWTLCTTRLNALVVNRLKSHHDVYSPTDFPLITCDTKNYTGHKRSFFTSEKFALNTHTIHKRRLLGSKQFMLYF